MPGVCELVEVYIPVLIPFEVFHALHKQGPEHFQVALLGDGGHAAISDFWEHALNEEWAYNHPVLVRNPDLIEYMFPLNYHLDGAEIHRNAEYYFFNCGSVLAQAAQTHSLDARILICGIPHVIMKLPGVKQSVMDLMACFFDWNHKVMEGKVLPWKGFYGECHKPTTLRAKHKGGTIMGEYIGVFTGTKSDGKARVT